MHTCGSVALDIKTYYAGQDQPTHPNVIAFESAWHGYRYYMAYTPYPYANGCEENPCLAGSNDLIHWETPAGLRNPIATSEELGCDELKDSHLLYRKDLDRLELWYMGRIDSTLAEGGQLHCLRKVSSDGRSWSNYEIMYSYQNFNLVSPSVIYDEAYLFWGVRHSKEETGLYFMRSDDGHHWSELQKCQVPDAVLTDMWHGTVISHENLWHFVWVGFDNPSCNRIYHAQSYDGIQFSKPEIIVENDTGWDHLYRPCLIFAERVWNCYYGVIRTDGKWLISTSRGADLHSLSGITIPELGLTDSSVEQLAASTSRLRQRHKKQQLKQLFAPKVLILIPFLLCLRLLHVSPIACWLMACLCGAGCAFILRKRKHAIWCGLFMGTLCASITAFISEILSQLFCWLH